MDRNSVAGTLKNNAQLTVIGWQERIDLPTLGLNNVRVKIDTGARTSALHATDVQRFEKDGKNWVRFQSRFDDDTDDTWFECPVHDDREITNTSGIPEERIIIRTKFRIARRSWTIDLSLTDRSNMKFRMIVGRRALMNHSIAVHTRRINLTKP